MNPQKMFQGAVETTTIIKERQSDLFTFGVTRLSYYFVSVSEIDSRDTLVRKGVVVVDKPRIVMPGNNPLFEGFETDNDELSNEDVRYVFFSRRIQLPSLKYTNTDSVLEVVPVPIDEEINRLREDIDKRKDTQTALIKGEDKFFPFPLLLYVGKMVTQSSTNTLTELLERGGFEF